MLLDEIAAFLQAQGLGTVGTTITIGRLPVDPDEACSVYEYGGSAPERGFGTTGMRYENSSFQVVFRGKRPGPGVTTRYSAPRLKAELAWRAFSALQPETLLSGTRYHMISPQQSPFSMGSDEVMRELIVCNYVVLKEPSP